MTATLNHRWCVGIDLHKDTLTACVYCRCCGEHTFKKLTCKCRTQIAEYFAALPRPHAVAIETVGFYRWLWEVLESFAEGRGLAGYRRQTNWADALCIAELLITGR